MRGAYSLLKDLHYPFVEKELSKLKKSSNILEVGCGLGQWVFYAEEKGIIVWGRYIKKGTRIY